MTESDRTPLRGSEHLGSTWTSFGLGLILAAACLFGFVGLGASGYSTDELFTLYLIDHHRGLSEVFRRALTDTHPPGYYFLLYAWSRAFGLSEASLRLPSVLFCTGAVALLVLGCGRAFTLQARLFAGAAAALSWFWLIESQNARNYGLCLLCSAILLALSIRARSAASQGRSVPAGLMIGLFLAGLIGSFTHFYELLVTGLTYLWLLVTIRQTRFRIAITAGGLFILALSLVYVRALLGQTQQDIHHMWFRSDLPFIVGVGWRGLRYTLGVGTGLATLILAAMALWRSRRKTPAPTPSESSWTTGLCAFVPAGVYVGGVAVTLLLAPSISSQNVLVASPFLWGLIARLYDLGRPLTYRGVSAAIALGIILSSAAELRLLPGRWRDGNEAWRSSAFYIQSLPDCRGQVVPVVQPWRFGPDSPFFRMLTERIFFGWYVKPGALFVRAFPIAAFTNHPDPRLSSIDRARIADVRTCRVLAWAVHDVDPASARLIARGLERGLGLPMGAVRIHENDSYLADGLTLPGPTPTAFVFEAAR
jgi:hypothetical protein